ncbi:2-dehydro-3-deoxygalactonokinase [Plastorhodobacter daqingensis]|uniref:2-dehydro-3-deoxygalactonokinase n=1 Tax=Plastorhodobacter daqingensis TaxID=1387281 RepID=A0ABW2UGY2_9RHOB
MTGFASTDWIAVAWGEHPRAFAMTTDGQIMAEATLDSGAAPENRLEPLIGPWQAQGLAGPVVIAGMAMPALARPVPCTPLEAPVANEAGHHLVPGLRQSRPAPGLTRGAETCIAGFLDREPQFDGVVCLPGDGPGDTTLWAQLSAGEVVSFQSFLTVRLISQLLPPEDEPGWDDAAFLAAVDDARSHPERLAARLAQVEAESQLQLIGPPAARARYTGLLIGAELAAARPYWLGQQVAILAASPAADPYRHALAALAVPLRLISATEMTLAGLTRAHRLLRGQP